MVVCVLCAAGPNGRGVFYVRLGSLVCLFIFGRVSGGCLGAVALACSVRGFGFILFVMRWIIPLCLILTAFFPPSPERAETLRRNLLFEGTMLSLATLGYAILCAGRRGYNT